MDTQGLPLTDIILRARENKAGVSLPQFFVDAVRAGWTKTHAIAVVREALTDTGAPAEYINAACKYLETKLIIGKKRR